MLQRLLHWFDLRTDQAPAPDIDAALRGGARAGGTNLWVLFFAMLIACVGLNVNSTAVIIGAMLISPLMGPIAAIGYGAAVADMRLIRTAVLSLLVFMVLSLATSTLYFTLSPLKEPGTELLARTSPSLWDVVIAAFGGAAGMVAATRRSFSNIVPGVAIATALMPPLCTVGFGLAHQRWDVAGGAMYLFLINGVFIAAGTLAVARVLRLPALVARSPGVHAWHRWAIAMGLLAVLAPSVWLGYRMVQDEVFQGGAQRALSRLEADTGVALLGREIDARARLIRLTVVGEAEQARVLAQAAPLLAAQRIGDARLEFRRAGDTQLRDLKRSGDQRDQRLAALAYEMQQMQQQWKAMADGSVPRTQGLLQELQAWLPQARGLSLHDHHSGTRELHLTLPHALHEHDAQRVKAWLATRLNSADFTLIQDTGPGRAKP